MNRITMLRYLSWRRTSTINQTAIVNVDAGRRFFVGGGRANAPQAAAEMGGDAQLVRSRRRS
jgi:hypothetical protein